MPLQNLAITGPAYSLTAPRVEYARFGNGSAVMATNGGRTIVQGFAWLDAAADDADTDQIPDGQELLANELDFVCRNRAPALYACEYNGIGLDRLNADTLAIESTVELTSDHGIINGCYGLARHPLSGETYVLYQATGAGSRRLGTLDKETGAITDIGNAGNLTDIDFGPGGILFGVTGSYSPDFAFVFLDLATASQGFLFTLSGASYGTSLAFRPGEDVMFTFNNNNIA